MEEKEILDLPPKKQKKVHWNLLSIPAFFILIGLLFKIQHWPYAWSLISVGATSSVGIIYSVYKEWKN